MEESASTTDTEAIEEMVLEYLKFHGYDKTYKKFAADRRKRGSDYEDPDDHDAPVLNTLWHEENKKEKKEAKHEKGLKELQRQHSSVLQSARQIFSIAINCLQQLHNIKDGNSMTDNLGETIDNYKNQLGKYHQILSTEGKCDRSELFSEAVMNEHKTKFIAAKKAKDWRAVVEVLLSLRVNALQISPELRKNLVYELIRNDIFLLQTKHKNNFLLDLLDIEKKSLRHALLALISVIVSTLKGAEYITSIDDSIVEKIIEILETEEDGSVNQRFCIAILQKVSIKEDTIPFLVKKGMVTWIVKLIGRSLDKEVHVFSLDFSSALLANILHAKTTAEQLSKDKKYVNKLLETMLKQIKEKIPTSVLMHLLICLSYLSKDSFSESCEAVGFFDRISEFVEWYSKQPTGDNENGEIDKRTVLDLCAHMFHPKDISNDMSQSMEYNDMKPEDKIREFENEQGDLIFECFQDEEKMFE